MTLSRIVEYMQLFANGADKERKKKKKQKKFLILSQILMIARTLDIYNFLIKMHLTRATAEN